MALIIRDYLYVEMLWCYLHLLSFCCTLAYTNFFQWIDWGDSHLMVLVFLNLIEIFSEGLSFWCILRISDFFTISVFRVYRFQFYSNWLEFAKMLSTCALFTAAACMCKVLWPNLVLPKNPAYHIIHIFFMEVGRRH